MKQDKETRNKLLESARAEFIEKGYMKASLRNICKNAGVTTGALYFFFEDKEDLFEAVTKETVEGIRQVMQLHYQDENEMLQAGEIDVPAVAERDDDFQTARQIIHQMYSRRDIILLVLTKSQGSRLENIADWFIENTEKHFQMAAMAMQTIYPDKKIDERFVHWLAHEQIEAFIYMITHIEEEEAAIRFMAQAIAYMKNGWYGLFVTRD